MSSDMQLLRSSTDRFTPSGSCDANDALHITVIQPGEQKPKTLYAFHPRFTYPIFGDDERIFGYQGLIIRLRFAAHDLRSHVHISYDDKFKEIGDTVALDLNKTLKDWIPECELACF
jgi:histone acetyltransferase 1